ncbi:ABC transporter permease [Microbacterium sp. KSW4-16]|uniref:ABC transporter permease n=1 Tax=Microbacterium TaxID=33882 RepID=UPI001039B50B|nr:MULTISPECIES: ABC transporter permease [Microbacterium]MCK8468473.1 ABC transporter permease [Microbacterium aurugineum]QEA27204.1 ABC transporter permease [Microbacterium sp. CBA3102]TCJ23493.1 ABC transporter permease [Microbacterium sp. PI-1]
MTILSSDTLAVAKEPRRRGFRRSRRFTPRTSFWTPVTVISFGVIAAWILAALLAPIIAPFDPLETSGPFLDAPSAAHWMGTDDLGRDVLSRVIYGAQLSLPLALAIVVFSLLVGGAVGLAAGYFGKAADNVLMRVADLVLAFPQIILAMAVAAAFGPSVGNAVLALVIVSWPLYARIIRSSVLSVREQEYVFSGRLLGSTTLKSIVKDVIPNSAGPALVMATIELGNAILMLAALSFLGLGPRPPAAEWGAMIALGSQNLGNWWISLFPGLAILTIVMAFNLLGDAVQDYLDPRSRNARK